MVRGRHRSRAEQHLGAAREQLEVPRAAVVARNHPASAAGFRRHPGEDVAAHLGPFGEVIEWASQEAKRPLQLLERRGAARDHPSLVGVPETDYLKCWVLLAP